VGLFGKKKGIVGVDIGSSAVKAVEIGLGFEAARPQTGCASSRHPDELGGGSRAGGLRS